MPTEIRHIVFRSDELFRALKTYRERTGQPLPAGQPERLDVSREPSIAVEIEMRTPAAERVVVAGDEVAAALILFCRDNGVPLPVESSKFLHLFGSSLGLVVTKEMKGVPVSAPPAPHP